MKIARAFHRFPSAQAPIIDLSNVRLEWVGLATLQGPSGSGKTTLFRLLSGWYDGPESICTFDPPIDSYRSIRFVGAHESLLPWRSINGNFAERGISSELAGAMLNEMELPPDILGFRTYELSYGMYKRVELALAVHDQPELLLLDEFFTSIDDPTKRVVRDYICHRRSAAQTLVTVHEAKLRESLTDNHLMLELDEVTRCVIGVVPSE